MAVNIGRNRLFVAEHGHDTVVPSLPTCGDADDVFFDERRHRSTVSCGEGVVDVFQRDGDRYRALARVKTTEGARTSLLVAELDRLFGAEHAGMFGSEAAILVLQPSP